VQTLNCAESSNKPALKKNLTLHIPKPIYSTDNAAMIASLARLKAEHGQLEKTLRYNYPAFAAFQG